MKGLGGPSQPLDLVLAHAVNEVVLLGRDKLSKPFTVDGLAAPLNGSKRSTINVYERRTHARDARHEQTISRRYAELIVHEIRDPRFACAWKQSVTHCLQRFDFVRPQHRHRRALRLCLARAQPTSAPSIVNESAASTAPCTRARL